MNAEAERRIDHARRRSGSRLDLSRLGLTALPESVAGLTTLVELDLTENRLTALPDWLGNLRRLDRLSLSRNQLAALPDSLGNLTALRQLYVTDNRLMALPESLGNLSELTRLMLADNALTVLPESLASLTKLAWLSLGSNLVADLPDWLGNLTELTELYLYRNALTAVPDWLGNLTALFMLDLSLNKLTAVPESLGNLTALSTLDLSGNPLAAVPESLGNLTGLSMLGLSGNGLAAIPEPLGNLTALTRLHLSDNRLTAVPDWLGNLTALSILDVSENQLTAIPESLGNLTALEQLNLAENQLTAIPESLANLTELRHLYLTDNQLTAIPDWLGHLVGLLQLSLSGNRLTEIPDTFGNLTQLTWLYLHKNRLASVPGTLGDARCLVHLFLSDNQLTEVPATLGNLTKLTSLRLSNNRLTTVPGSFAELPADSLILDGNPLAPEIQAAYDHSRTELVTLLRLLRDDGVLIREAKLVLAGEGEAGKSSLLAAMRDEPWVKDRSTTHGIEIKPVTVTTPGGTEIMLNGWDFGGQPDYRPTHQLFFTAPAVYVVVWSPRRGPEVSFVDYWLDLIRHRAGDHARVHVVATHADTGQRGAWIDEAALRRRFGDMIVKFHHVDSETGRGVAELKASLAETAEGLPHVTRRYPARWLRLREVIRRSGEPYLSYRRYEQVAQKHGLSAVDARSLAINSNALGHWIYYADDPQLADIVTVKPDWLSTAISFVLDDTDTRQSSGLLVHRRLTRLWQNPERSEGQRYPIELHPVFLHLMEKFEICYRIVTGSPISEPTSLVAQLVASEQPDLETAWHGYGAGLEERVHVCEIVDSAGSAVTPTGLMYRLIVRLHRYSLGRHEHSLSRHWQAGLVVDNDFHGRALITVDRNRLTITVRAAYPPYLLHRLTETIREHVDDYWPGLTVRVLIPCGAECGRGQPGTGLFNLEALIVTKQRGHAESLCPTCMRFQGIDALLSGIEPARIGDRDGLARAIARATEPAFDSVLSVIDARAQTIIEAVQNQQRQSVDAIRTVGHDTLRAISQAEERYRDLILALDDEARDGPRLFSIDRIEPSLLRPGWTHQRVRLTLWCEHSRMPVHVLNAGQPPTGIYDISLPREWLVAAAPWLKAASIFLRGVLPIAAGALDLSLPDPQSWQQTLSKQLEAAEASLEAVTDAADSLSGSGPSPHRVETIGEHGPVQRDATLLRVLRKHLAEVDPSFAGLIRVRLDNTYRWVHPRYLPVYYPPLPEIPTG